MACDRFGIKPLYYCPERPDRFLFASEIKALFAAGIQRQPNTETWGEYLAYGLYDHSEKTFWKNVYALPAGSYLSWRPSGKYQIYRWYDLPAKVKEPYSRSDEDALEEFLENIEENVRLRFRSDVPVGINLSGGLDSSLLLGTIAKLRLTQSKVRAFTFVTGDEAYDETPWVRDVISLTKHPHQFCLLDAGQVPELAQLVAFQEDEPFGGLPTLAYSRAFEASTRTGDNRIVRWKWS